MNTIQTGTLPELALLSRYKQQGAYTDCYFVDVPGQVSQTAYVEAFYTTRLFKAERFILKWLARRPSTDEEARLLAAGGIEDFAAWRVEARTPAQLLMCDFMGSTRSWLMSVPGPGGDAGLTRLYFGSAVVPQRDERSGRASFGLWFHALKHVHLAYSRALLRSARARLQ